MNLFGIVRNDPISYIDKLGLAPSCNRGSGRGSSGRFKKCCSGKRYDKRMCLCCAGTLISTRNGLAPNGKCCKNGKVGQGRPQWLIDGDASQNDCVAKCMLKSAGISAAKGAAGGFIVRGGVRAGIRAGLGGTVPGAAIGAGIDFGVCMGSCAEVKCILP